MTMEIEMKNIQEAEGLEISPHAHTTEGALYCNGGELDVISKDETVTLGSESRKS